MDGVLVVAERIASLASEDSWHGTGGCSATMKSPSACDRPDVLVGRSNCYMRVRFLREMSGSDASVEMRF